MQQFITHSIAQYGYVAIFLLVMLGSACIPIPSEIVLVFGGALASGTFANQALGGDPTTHLSLWGVILVALAGGLVGSWLGYGIGAVGGRPLIDRWGRYLLFKPHEVDRAHAWFERRGEALVFFGRLVPLVRAFVSLPAGVARMNPAKFTLYTMLGLIPWTVGFTFLGYELGEQWHTVEKYLQPIAILVAIVLLVAFAWWIRRRLRERRAEATDKG
jgi:membrane protein DedA with SNARE-associated domain